MIFVKILTALPHSTQKRIQFQNNHVNKLQIWLWPEFDLRFRMISELSNSDTIQPLIFIFVPYISCKSVYRRHCFTKLILVLLLFQQPRAPFDLGSLPRSHPLCLRSPAYILRYTSKSFFTYVSRTFESDSPSRSQHANSISSDSMAFQSPPLSSS